MQIPYYDKDKMRVVGDGYYIQWLTTITSEGLIEAFMYQDEKMAFCFEAERRKWIVPPGSTNPSKSIDTESYTIVGLWYEEVRVAKKIRAPEALKIVARKNILEGMMFMEERSRKPPKDVTIARE